MKILLSSNVAKAARLTFTWLLWRLSSTAWLTSFILYSEAAASLTGATSSLFNSICFTVLSNEYLHMDKQRYFTSAKMLKFSFSSYFHTHTQLLNGFLSGTTRVGRYQKKHSPTHTHPDHQTSFINFLHLLWSTASSLFNLCAWQSFLQPLSRLSLVLLLVWDPLLHTPCISSPNHHHPFATHVHTITACFAVVPMLCHLLIITLIFSLAHIFSFSLIPAYKIILHLLSNFTSPFLTFSFSYFMSSCQSQLYTAATVLVMTCSYS